MLTIPGLALADIAENLQACRSYCLADHSRQAAWRSPALEAAAIAVFPISCHTPYSREMIPAMRSRTDSYLSY
jgi:hypothetical protein